ncbi:MAG TPA: hypothetical protein VIV11_39655 [Kofleriaceae bacterium]
MSSRVAACCLVLCACWRGSGEPEADEPTEARVKGATCEEVGLNVREVVRKAEDKELAARATALRTLVQRRCEADGWAIELRRCVAGAKSVDDGRTCRDKLATQQQRDAFAHDVEVMIVTEDGQ